jgi:hypothetical protein
VSDLITWNCVTCGGAIFGRSGYLGVIHEQMAGGGPITWTPWHDSCHIDDDVAYDIGVDMLRTRRQVLDWTEHLSAKNWHHRSNWAALMLTRGIDVTSREMPPEPTAPAASVSR